VQLLFACILVMASATSECAGQETCAEEKDTTALMQRNVKVLAVESADEGNPDGDGGSMEGKDPTKAPDKGCISLKWENQCAFFNDCSWTGEKDDGQSSDGCSTACHKFTEESTCPDYCFFGGVEGKQQSCSSVVDSVNVGGKENKWRNKDTIVRPGFITRERLIAETDQWEACGYEGKTSGQSRAEATDCWIGRGIGRATNRLELADEKYSSAAITVGIDCEFAGLFEVKLLQGSDETEQSDGRTLVRSENAEWRIWYNFQEISEASCNCNFKEDSCKCKYEQKSKAQAAAGPLGLYTIKTNSNDADPQLRIEVSRQNAGQNALAEVGVTLRNVPRAFDECMTLKSGHANCLEEQSVLKSTGRSDHQSQLTCLERKEGYEKSFEGCENWRACLSQDSITYLKAINRALLPKKKKEEKKKEKKKKRKGKGKALVQVPGQTQLAQQRVNATGLPDRGTCISPDTIDPEAWDCKCFDWIYELEKENGQGALHDQVCCDKNVCKDWIETNCDDNQQDPEGVECVEIRALALVQNAMTVRSEQTTDSQDTMTVRSEQTKVASLDESLSGKRCA